MGISGLLPFLEHATKPCHVSEFRGATVVVDTYCWLHKGVSACTMQLAASEDTQIYVNYCLKYVKMLQSFDIRPILVFDGKNLPAKANTDAKRRESRTKAKQRATELLRLGKTAEAQMFLKQSINVTPEMASAVIKECHKINVDCIVAPYESDAQLAFFNLKGVADIVITEDSDLLLFGCSKVLFKLDMRGCGYLVESDKIQTAMKLRPDKYTFEKFRHMCILSGCDYVDSLQGIGLKRAQKFISLTDQTNPELFLDKLPRYLNMNQLKVTDEYKENFMVAEATFRHQTVFDPFKRKLVPLTDPAVCGTNPKYCKNAGDIFDHEKAYQVALGNLHPSTFKKLNNWAPSEAGSSTHSIWSGVYKRTESRKEQKAKFKEFFKSSVKVEVKMEEKDEETKIMEDIQTTRELEFYSCSSVKSDETKIEEKPISEIREKCVPPVLSRNPFILRKKLSKFGLTTESDSKVIVKSRYFASSSEQMEKLEINKAEIKKEEVEVNELSDVENNASEINSVFSDLEPNVDSIESNFETNSKTEDVSCQGITRDEVKPIISIDLCTEEMDYASSTILKYEDTGQCSKQNYSQRSTTDGSILKRKKVSSCRFVGLKRTKSDGQQTIRNFFTKMTQK